jgi:hypothetical protein
MNMRVNGNLSIVGQIKDLKVHQLSADPASPVLSQVWFNSTDAALRYYDGVAVQTIAKGGNLENYLKLDGTSAMTGELTLASSDQSAAADTSAVSKGHLDTVAGTKQDNITGAATTITSADLSASKIAVTDASGKVAATTTATAAEAEYLAGVTSAIQTQLDNKEGSIGYTPVDKAGDTMSGNLAMNGNLVSGLGAPVNANDALRKVDMDTAMAGLDFQPDVLERQTDATLDPTATPTEGDRYIIGDAAAMNANFGTIAGVENGDIVEYDGSAFVVIYDVSVSGEGAITWNRARDSFQYYNGTNWSDFGGLAGATAGIGLAKAGNNIYVNMGAGISQLPADEVGLDLYADGGLILSLDGVTPSTDTAAQLSVLADNSTVETSASGVRVKASGVTEAHINGSAAGDGINGGDGTALSVATAAASGITVDATGVSVDRAELRNTFLGRDGVEAMTGVLNLSGSDQSAAGATAAISKGHLDAALTSQSTATSDLETRVEAGYFVYDGTAAAATSHTVTHNMGNKYVQVTVVDSTDEVVIPESIVYTDANSLTVTFTQSANCRVIVTALKAAA